MHAGLFKRGFLMDPCTPAGRQRPANELGFSVPSRPGGLDPWPGRSVAGDFNCIHGRHVCTHVLRRPACQAAQLKTSRRRTSADAYYVDTLIKPAVLAERTLNAFFFLDEVRAAHGPPLALALLLRVVRWWWCVYVCGGGGGGQRAQLLETRQPLG